MTLLPIYLYLDPNRRNDPPVLGGQPDMVVGDLESLGGVPQTSVAGSPEQSVDQSGGSGRRQAGRTPK